MILRHSAMIPTKAGTLPTPQIVVLAAGFSARLGRPKALAKVRGLSLLARTIRVLAPFATSKIIVVVPPGAGRYQNGPRLRSVIFAANPHRAAGLSSSVRLGLRRSRRSPAALLLPVDLVDLRRRDIARLIGRWRGARRNVVARKVRGGAGTPLILPRWLYASALELAGDHGLRDVVRRLPDHVLLVKLPSAESDVDTAQDLARARRRMCPARPTF
jgi:molybdenum cofactor cytidylyltransferase